MPTRENLIEAAEAAKLLARREPTQAHRTAATAASAELSAWIMANDPPRVIRRDSPYTAAARSGARQHAETFGRFRRR